VGLVWGVWGGVGGMWGYASLWTFLGYAVDSMFGLGLGFPCLLLTRLCICSSQASQKAFGVQTRRGDVLFLLSWRGEEVSPGIIDLYFPGKWNHQWLFLEGTLGVREHWV